MRIAANGKTETVSFHVWLRDLSQNPIVSQRIKRTIEVKPTSEGIQFTCIGSGSRDIEPVFLPVPYPTGGISQKWMRRIAYGMLLHPKKRIGKGILIARYQGNVLQPVRYGTIAEQAGERSYAGILAANLEEEGVVWLPAEQCSARVLYIWPYVTHMDVVVKTRDGGVDIKRVTTCKAFQPEWKPKETEYQVHLCKRVMLATWENV